VSYREGFARAGQRPFIPRMNKSRPNETQGKGTQAEACAT